MLKFACFVIFAQHWNVSVYLWKTPVLCSWCRVQMKNIV